MLVRELSRNLPSYSEKNILTYRFISSVHLKSHNKNNKNCLHLRFWNWVQPALRCCGVSSPESYSAWAGVAGLDANWRAPPACCIQETDKGEQTV